MGADLITFRALFNLLLLGALSGCGQNQTPAESRTPAEQELLRVWSVSDANVRERAAAVNRCFTNGTRIPIIVSVLGTNYEEFRPISTVWVGPGPEPRKTCALFYRFGQDGEGVIIGTTIDITGNPLAGEFTGAGFSVLAETHPTGPSNKIWIGRADGNLPEWVKKSMGTTNGIRLGQTNGVANRSQPVPSGTNRTPTGTAPGGH